MFINITEKNYSLAKKTLKADLLVREYELYKGKKNNFS